jgi:hypothetical protein
MRQYGNPIEACRRRRYHLCDLPMILDNVADVDRWWLYSRE